MTTQPDRMQGRVPLRIMLQIVGPIDVAAGLAVALGGPPLVGGDPLVDAVLMGGGAFLALTGAGMWVWGRFGIAAERGAEPAESVARRPRRGA
jgi:hypothetical protein